MRRLCILALLTALTGTLLAQPAAQSAAQSAATPAGAVVAEDTTYRLDQLVQAYRTAKGFNGSVLVTRGQTILLEKGYGWRDAARRLPNTPTTRFQIASTTKTFTSTMVLRLAAAGQLTLGDKLKRWFPELPYADSVTIEQMLTHTSGIWNFTRGEIPKQTDEQKMIVILKTHPLDFPPGTSWSYSNSNYVLLGYIVGRIMGESYFEAVRRTIFEPLRMTDSGFDFTHTPATDKAVGYKTLNDTLAIPDEITDSSVPFAAGAIYSSVGDLYRWHRALQDGLILPAEWQTQAYKKYHGYDYGYGWTVDSIGDKRVVSHSGSIAGFGSDFERVPEDDICVAVLSNKDGSTGEVTHICKSLLAILYGRPYGIPHSWTTRTLPPAELQRYEGVYEFPQIGLNFRIWVEDGQLYVQSINRPGPRSTLLCVGPDHFITKEDEEAECWFHLTEGTLTVSQMGKKLTGARRQ